MKALVGSAFYSIQKRLLLANKCFMPLALSARGRWDMCCKSDLDLHYGRPGDTFARQFLFKVFQPCGRLEYIV